MNDHAPAPGPAAPPAPAPAPGPAAPPAPAPVAGEPAPAPDRAVRLLRRSALCAGLLFLPAVLLGVVLALASESGTACVMRGTCGEVPGWLYWVTLAVGGGAWLRALTVPYGAPPTPARWAALWTLIGAELLFLGLVMAYFNG
ncbi:hypothetical protein AB0M64_20840 [Streptomyces sp. NPDC051771]|uniref:hypothetical protein n=1 Tax=Streptomyces sp. NPDC051771 TaxID=3154847 RepID=UPI00341E90E4